MSVFRRFFVVRLCAIWVFMGLGVLAIAQAPSASARTVNGCEIVDSPTADQHTDCPGADLSGADLHFANLRFANLQGADLQGADLDRANLFVAQLQLANLRGANLLAAYLPGAGLQFAVLYNADLTGADLSYASLSGARFDSTTKICATVMPNGSIDNRDCGALGAKPPLSKSRTFVLAATTTRTFDVGYPSALKYRRAKYFCDTRISGRGKRYVKILSHRSARGGTVCRVKARNNAKIPSLDTTAKITVAATTIR